MEMETPPQLGTDEKEIVLVVHDEVRSLQMMEESLFGCKMANRLFVQKEMAIRS